MHFCVMIVTLMNFSSEITKEGGEDVEVVRTEEWTTVCATIVENLDITRKIAVPRRRGRRGGWRPGGGEGVEPWQDRREKDRTT